jgi:uncharacterized protein YceK
MGLICGCAAVINASAAKRGVPNAKDATNIGT